MLVNPIKLLIGKFTSFPESEHSTGCYKYSDGMFDITNIFPHNGDHVLWGRNDFDRSYVEVDGVEPYGVCDTPEQFKEKFAQILENDPRPLVVLFTHVAKDPENKGLGGGWRWHKWGEYIGDGMPTREHLDDEEKFEKGIYCFHIYVVDNLSYATEDIQDIQILWG